MKGTFIACDEKLINFFPIIKIFIKYNKVQLQNYLRSCMYLTGELSMKIGELMDEKFPSNDVTTVTT
jgi:hypothetical protein